jgi:hypothetical protein
LLFVISDKNDGLFTFDKLAEFLGVEAGETPVIVLFTDHKRLTKYKYKGHPVVVEDILNFIEGGKINQIPQFYKSETVPLADRSSKPVKEVVGRNF